MQKLIFILCLLPFLTDLFFSKKNTQQNFKTSRNELIKLGQHFFFDNRLSYNLAKSCSSCHDPQLAFTDGYRLSLNSSAEVLKRNAPSLLNINHRKSFDWSNPDINQIEQQMDRPFFSTSPVELGILENETLILQRFKADTIYQRLFFDAYSEDISNLNLSHIKEAIAHYELNLQSRNSKFDHFLSTKDSTLLTRKERLGMQLFFSDSISCNSCHGGKDFFEPERGSDFANIGLYNCDNRYPLRDRGMFQHTLDPNDDGVFRIPTLRNVEITSPYYHDGSGNSLIEVIENYGRTGRKYSTGECIGDGAGHPNVDGRLTSFNLTLDQKKSLVAFLCTLTDTSYVRNPRFVNPFLK